MHFNNLRQHTRFEKAAQQMVSMKYALLLLQDGRLDPPFALFDYSKLGSSLHEVSAWYVDCRMVAQNFILFCFV